MAASADTQKVRIVLEVPNGVNSRAFVSALQSWLCRYGARIETWGPEKKSWPLASLFERAERP